MRFESFDMDKKITSNCSQPDSIPSRKIINNDIDTVEPISTSPNKKKYIIRKAELNTNESKFETDNYNEAIRLCLNNKGYNVYDYKNTLLYKPMPKIKNEIIDEKVRDVLYIGRAIRLNGESIYMSAYSDNIKSVETGIVYLYDGIIKNKRLKICKKRENCGKGYQYIFGYISIKSIN